MRILTEGAPTLREKSIEIPEITKKVVMKAREMLKLMYRSDGIGLAAPQVGWNVRLFVMNLSGKLEDEMVFINPVLFPTGEPEIGLEGCLSVPDKAVYVERKNKVLVRGMLITGRELKKSHGNVLVDLLASREYSGLAARCIQHETDHLNGVLISDYIKEAPQPDPKQTSSDQPDDSGKPHTD